ncbi:MAG: HEAT repeat domain-containing protein [Hyphomicrobiales bacterium]
MGTEEDNSRLLDEIENLEIDKETDLKRAIELYNNDEEEVRMRAIEALIHRDTQSIRSQIHVALDDADELVRICALEWVEEHVASEFREKSIKLTRDEDAIVRAYAFDVLGVIGSKSDLMFIKSFIKTATEREKTSIYAALHKLGDPFAINEYYEILVRKKDHTARVAAANMLDARMENIDWQVALSKIEKAYGKNEPISVQSAFDNAIKWIKEEKLN